ncbi:serine/threonine protein kinase [Candidatus Reidiella endopervernicosa]|uniref:Serine/threonine protein kinase n=1 Tax=Candidatus Reidiella endopervernicosa TaxID=2738883 RepID=A0A6N0HU02_9GAMM|nr:serine/threonine protein kinase [Candidatus Reidiella endopervernicosa]
MNVEAAALQLPGYEVGPVLYRSEGRVVYRARRLADGEEVAIETIDAEYPERHQVAGIRREGVIAQSLVDVAGVRRVHAVLSHGSGNLALVCELFDSPLSTHLVQTSSVGLPLAEVLDIALRLVRILGGIHDQNIVHKALTPENVLFDTASGAIALAGFGIASELDRERQSVQMSRRIEGSLPYISPEQTGRMNRDLDYRSDYYSLGVLLFELLTGQRPFQADTTLEWVHSHISRLPPAPHEISPELPEVLSAIVLKLLDKSPDVRYQSAEGLIDDLTRCADELATTGRVEPFLPGRHDVAQNFWCLTTSTGVNESWSSCSNCSRSRRPGARSSVWSTATPVSANRPWSTRSTARWYANAAFWPRASSSSSSTVRRTRRSQPPFVGWSSRCWLNRKSA